MIRKATEEDLSRVAEIFVFNNRINYFPIFKQEEYSFGELQVVSMIDHYFGKGEVLENLYVADECGIVKGFMEIHGTEIRKLYVDPCFQSGGIGKKLMEYAISTLMLITCGRWRKIRERLHFITDMDLWKMEKRIGRRHDRVYYKDDKGGRFRMAILHMRILQGH